ncbi:GTP cyclohydrolase II RibA [Nocardia brasiliensis]|uniref:GTP cyclohydrolase II RibA n=1 Tax=Nocardia brasiliensis TaxID=37326 RepID=UPI003D8B36E3
MIDSPQAAVRARVPVVLERPRRSAAELVTFDHLIDQREHLALVIPTPADRIADVPLVRVHSECLTGDVFGCDRCDCGQQLRYALVRIIECGGAILYLRQEGRDIGLYNKLDAYLIQDAGYDTYEANQLLGREPDERDYRVAAQMLYALGMSRIALLSGNQDKAGQLRASGIDVDSVVSCGHNYLRSETAPVADAAVCW